MRVPVEVVEVVDVTAVAEEPAEVELATEVAAVPSKAVANTNVPSAPALVGRTMTRELES